MTRRKQRTTEPEELRGDMTPMIDVIFQLLIFFIFAMDIKQLEGKIANYLPTNMGLEAVPNEQPIPPELRVRLVTDDPLQAQIQLEERPIGTVMLEDLGEGQFREADSNAAVWARLENDMRTWLKMIEPEARREGTTPYIAIDPVNPE